MRVVAFASVADNLSEVDSDGTFDIFVRELVGDRPIQPGPPPDGPSQPVDTRGPAIRARALSSANGTIRVSRTGRFKLFCGRYSEPVTGTCRARSTRSIGASPRRILRLSAKPFRSPARRRVLLRFRLSSRDLEALTAARRVRMRATLTARDRLGNPTTVGFRFTLLAPQHR